eukprot:s4365_g2.t1
MGCSGNLCLPLGRTIWTYLDKGARVSLNYPCHALAAAWRCGGRSRRKVLVTFCTLRSELKLRAPDGLLIWSSGDEVWEWLIPGSKPPEEVIYAEVFVDASEPSRGCLDSPSSKRLGHFEVDLIAFENKEDELPQRLVSHFFTPAEAGDANACFVGKVRLSLQVSWECRGGHGVRELRRQTRESEAIWLELAI